MLAVLLVYNFTTLEKLFPFLSGLTTGNPTAFSIRFVLILNLVYILFAS
jgi:hypothetical protein